MQTSLTERVLARDPRAVARALTLLEDGGRRSDELDALVRVDGHAGFVVGITGPPGAGKSTLVDGLVGEIRQAGQTVAVLAVDPASAVTGGALLGDRVRMQRHASDAGVFIRSMSNRGQLGGVARATGGAVRLLEAAGFDVILIETVGVGQGEIAVASLADAVVVTLVPGMGDDVQALKAGVMDVADVFAINKADRGGGDDLAASLELALSLSPRRDAWTPPIVRTVATTGEGVGDLLSALARFREQAGGVIAERRARRASAAGRLLDASVDHVAYATADAEALMAFFRDTFAVTATTSETVPAHGVRVRFLEFAGGAGGRVEVLEPAGDRSAIRAFLDRRGAGLHHVALRVHDLPATLASLAARGVRLVDAAPRPGAGGTRVAFVHPSATGGLLVELVEHGGDVS